MLQSLDFKNIPSKKVHLLFETRKESGILYRNELEKLSEENSNFSYAVAISKEENWQGTKGHIHEFYQGLYPIPNPNRLFLLCGWSNMIDEAVVHLISMGYTPQQIKYELYG